MRACTVTSSAVVGSSAIRELRITGQRLSNHHALAHSAGQRVRIAFHDAIDIGNTYLSQQFTYARMSLFLVALMMVA